MMARLDEMEVFAEVVEAESFSAAARTLGLSKSAVSKQISRLEDRLGVRLLNRTTRSLNVTDVGEAVELGAQVPPGVANLAGDISGRHGGVEAAGDAEHVQNSRQSTTMAP